jgi:shikimate dehydrogenase
MTRPYAEVIGDPIAHSKSPLIHNFWLGKLGIDAEYRTCRVRPEELKDYFARRRGDAEWRGCNVTLPHKMSVLEFVDEHDSSVDDVGAANCIVPRDGRLFGFNTDVDGINDAIPGRQTPACMIGAGGAARAAIPALSFWMGLFDLRIIVRDKLKAEVAFASHKAGIKFYGFDEADQALCNVEAVINASPLGMTGQPSMPQSVIDAIALTDGTATVFDMVYSPLETELLKAARANDLEVVNGLVMLVGQAKAAFEHFFGARPTEEFDAELRTLLTA